MPCILVPVYGSSCSSRNGRAPRSVSGAAVLGRPSRALGWFSARPLVDRWLSHRRRLGAYTKSDRRVTACLGSPVATESQIPCGPLSEYALGLGHFIRNPQYHFAILLVRFWRDYVVSSSSPAHEKTKAAFAFHYYELIKGAVTFSNKKMGGTSYCLSGLGHLANLSLNCRQSQPTVDRNSNSHRFPNNSVPLIAPMHQSMYGCGNVCRAELTEPAMQKVGWARCAIDATAKRVGAATANEGPAKIAGEGGPELSACGPSCAGHRTHIALHSHIPHAT